MRYLNLRAYNKEGVIRNRFPLLSAGEAGEQALYFEKRQQKDQSNGVSLQSVPGSVAAVLICVRHEQASAHL